MSLGTVSVATLEWDSVTCRVLHNTSIRGGADTVRVHGCVAAQRATGSGHGVPAAACVLGPGKPSGLVELESDSSVNFESLFAVSGLPHKGYDGKQCSDVLLDLV